MQDLFKKRTIVVEMNATNMTLCCCAYYEHTSQRVGMEWDEAISLLMCGVEKLEINLSM